MTYGEFALLRVLREASYFAQLPIDIIRAIIRHVNLRARVAYRRRLRLNAMNLAYEVAQEEQYGELAYLMQEGKWPHLWAEIRARVRRENSRRGPGF